MPDHEPRFRVPGKCPKCGEVGSVRPKTTVAASTVAVCWRCRQCHATWPLTPRDFIERRRAPSDRRVRSRNERRSKAD